MLIAKLKTFIKSLIDAPLIDFKWSETHNEKFFEQLKKNCDEEYVQSTRFREDLKITFKEIFEPIGTVLIKLTGDKLLLKIIPYKTQPKDSINLSVLVDMIENNEDLIEYDYNNKEDLIYLKKELTLELIHFVNHINNEEINKKELLKYAVREAFELHDSDIVIIKNSQVFIKIFDENSTRKVSDEEKNTIAGRFNGIDEEELKSFYNDFFLKECHKNFFYNVAEEFVDVYLLDKKIDNIAYEKYVFSIIQSIISEHLVNLFDHNDDFAKGFSGYVFRIHFKEVFGHIANLILSEMSTSNRYIIDFLKYYSLNVVVMDGMKYRVPEIEAPNGLKWNVSSMMSIVKIYVKADTSMEEAAQDIEELEEKISELFIGEHSPLEHNAVINKEIEKISQNLIYASKRLNIYIDTFDSSKNEDEKSKLKEEIREMQSEIEAKKDTKSKLMLQLVGKAELIKYNNLKRELDSLGRQQKRDEKILSQNKVSYLSIRNSLVKALTSKKVLIEE